MYKENNYGFLLKQLCTNNEFGAYINEVEIRDC